MPERMVQAPNTNPKPLNEGVASDNATRDKLVTDNLGLVKLLARQIARRLPPNIEVSELISLGTMGLIDAATRYDPSMNVPFDAFARRRINGSMLDYLRTLDVVSRGDRKFTKAEEEAIRVLWSRFNRAPTQEEIAEHMDFTLDEYLKLRQSSDMHEVPIDDPRIDPTFLASGDAVEEHTYQNELKAEFKKIVDSNSLGERDRKILELYLQGLTMKKIGEQVEVGESRVSQLLVNVTNKIREGFKQKGYTIGANKNHL